MCTTKGTAPKEASMKNYTFIDILNDERGHELVDRIEEALSEIDGRGINPEDESSIWVSQKNNAIEDLEREFGFEWA